MYDDEAGGSKERCLEWLFDDARGTCPKIDLLWLFLFVVGEDWVFLTPIRILSSTVTDYQERENTNYCKVLQRPYLFWYHVNRLHLLQKSYLRERFQLQIRHFQFCNCLLIILQHWRKFQTKLSMLIFEACTEHKMIRTFTIDRWNDRFAYFYRTLFWFEYAIQQVLVNFFFHDFGPIHCFVFRSWHLNQLRWFWWQWL